jgi:hypothetical protein
MQIHTLLIINHTLSTVHDVKKGSSLGCCMVVSAVPVVCGRPEKDCRETLGGILFRSFAVVGSQNSKGK